MRFVTNIFIYLSIYLSIYPQIYLFIYLICTVQVQVLLSSSDEA